MKIVKKKIDELREAPYNPRKMSKEEYEKLKRSIERFGYIDPLVWNKRTGNVVGGNQRLKILKELGFTVVDVVEIDIDENAEKALNLALNKISGVWDLEKLEEVLRSLEGPLIELAGFEPEEVEDILNEVNLEELYTDIEEGPKEPRIKTHTCPNCGTVFTDNGEIVEKGENL